MHDAAAAAGGDATDDAGGRSAGTDSGVQDLTQLSILDLIHRAGQKADELFAAHRGSLDVTPRQLSVLLAIAAHEGANQADIGERTATDRSTMTDIIARLEKKGLVQRHRTAADARAYALGLTAESRAMLPRLRELAAKTEAGFLSRLSSAERDALRVQLARVIRPA